MATHQQEAVDIATQQQQNSAGSTDAAAGGAPVEEPLYTRYQKTAKKSTSNQSFITKLCNWFSKKSSSTDAQESTEQRQPQEIPDETPKPPSEDTSKEVHGYDNEALWLVRCLIKPDDGDFKAIGIVGMPEIGKTALAGLVFHNDYVEHHFLPRIWVSVSGTAVPKKQKVVETILRELGVDGRMIEDFAQRGVAALLYALHLKLAGKRYLIVLDGVSKDDDCCRNLISPDPANVNGEDKYEEFSFAFPKGSGGAVIVTCRRKETAEKMVGVGEGKEKEKILHTPRPIEDLDSCFLMYNSFLEKQVQTVTNDLKKELKMKTGGLPMAARLMAEIKNEQDHSRTELEQKQKLPQQNNGRPNETDHQTVGSGAENSEIVGGQDEDTHADEGWQRVDRPTDS